MPNLTIYINKELYFKLQKAVDKQGINESKLICSALDQYLTKHATKTEKKE